MTPGSNYAKRGVSQAIQSPSLHPKSKTGLLIARHKHKRQMSNDFEDKRFSTLDLKKRPTTSLKING
jgi:hypothetical protein